MGSFIRKTINDALDNGYSDPSVVDRPSALLRFMRRRYTPLSGIPETMVAGGTIGAFLVAPYAAPTMVLPLALWHTGWAAAAAPAEVGRAAVRTARFLRRLGQGGAEFAGPMVDTRMAYTMRQSALQAMHDSAYSLRAAIGNEARLLHS